VHSIKFEFGLAAYANGGHSNFIFNAAVDLVIFGKRLYLAVNFNLNDPVGSLKTGADTATEWYKDKMNNKAATDTEKNYYDNPNPFADFEMSGTRLNIIKQTNNRRTCKAVSDYPNKRCFKCISLDSWPGPTRRKATLY